MQEKKKIYMLSDNQPNPAVNKYKFLLAWFGLKSIVSVSTTIIKCFKCYIDHTCIKITMNLLNGFKISIVSTRLTDHNTVGLILYFVIHASSNKFLLKNCVKKILIKLTVAFSVKCSFSFWNF